MEQEDLPLGPEVSAKKTNKTFLDYNSEIVACLPFSSSSTQSFVDSGHLSSVTETAGRSYGHISGEIVRDKCSRLL